MITPENRPRTETRFDISLSLSLSPPSLSLSLSLSFISANERAIDFSFRGSDATDLCRNVRSIGTVLPCP
jgi:hypothetical protein